MTLRLLAVFCGGALCTACTGGGSTGDDTDGETAIPIDTDEILTCVWGTPDDPREVEVEAVRPLATHLIDTVVQVPVRWYDGVETVIQVEITNEADSWWKVPRYAMVGGEPDPEQDDACADGWDLTLDWRTSSEERTVGASGSVVVRVIDPVTDTITATGLPLPIWPSQLAVPPELVDEDDVTMRLAHSPAQTFLWASGPARDFHIAANFDVFGPP